MHVLAYWLARVALMFAVFIALWGLGATPWFAVVAAAVIAWLISYAIFGAMHDAAAAQMERWLSRRLVGVAGDEVAEDAEARAERTTPSRTTTRRTTRAATSSGPAAAPRTTTSGTPAKPSS